MAIIEWNDSYSVKIKEIDQQHQRLIAILNELHDAMRQGKGQNILETIIKDLINYTAMHFKTEERYFTRFNYEGETEHLEEHQGFVTRVSDFQKGFQDGKMALSVEILTFLSDWIKNHILGSDKKYTDCFLENGLQ